LKNPSVSPASFLSFQSGIVSEVRPGKERRRKEESGGCGGKLRR